MTVSNNTIKADGKASFFTDLGSLSAMAGEKIDTNVLKIQAELWRLLRTLLQQLQLKALKQLYQQYSN